MAMKTNPETTNNETRREPDSPVRWETASINSDGQQITVLFPVGEPNAEKKVLS